MMPDLESLLAIALRAADTAAEMIRSRPAISVLEKHDRDLVSDVDIAIERKLRQELARATPGIGFLGEEEGRTGNPATGWLWTLDPIDGTSNFTHGLPLCAVSLALLRGSRSIVGVIDAPLLGQRFYAAKGRGAFKGNERLSVGKISQLRDAVVAVSDYATGPGADRENELRLAVTTLLAPRVHRVRMLGTAALDLAWVAAGYLDGCVILNNNPWDTAAGAVIAREAGADVADASGNPHNLNSAMTIAASPLLINKLTALVRAASISNAGRQDERVADGSSYASLDAVLREGRHLIFDFDGPVGDLATGSFIGPAPMNELNGPARSDVAPKEGDPDDLPTAAMVTPAAYVHEAITACRDSGRTPSLVTRYSLEAIGAWLARYGLDDLISRIFAANDCSPGPFEAHRNLIGQAVEALGARPEECALITASAKQADIARSLGLGCIGYAFSPAHAERLQLARAQCVVPSLADLTLRLRARPTVSHSNIVP
jgi:myo-inositol-1(or 4)-monophosphatase